MNSDFKDLLQSLHEFDVRYLVAGGYAVIHHAQPRYTKDIDIWLDPNSANAAKLMKAFAHFGIPLIDIEQSDFATPGTQFSIGVPPCEIDFLTTIPGLEFTNQCMGKQSHLPTKRLPYPLPRETRPHQSQTNSRSPPRFG